MRLHHLPREGESESETSSRLSAAVTLRESIEHAREEVSWIEKARKPNIRSAAAFQWHTVPARSQISNASGEQSKMRQARS